MNCASWSEINNNVYNLLNVHRTMKTRKLHYKYSRPSQPRSRIPPCRTHIHGHTPVSTRCRNAGLNKTARDSSCSCPYPHSSCTRTSYSSHLCPRAPWSSETARGTKWSSCRMTVCDTCDSVTLLQYAKYGRQGFTLKENNYIILRVPWFSCC